MKVSTPVSQSGAFQQTGPKDMVCIWPSSTMAKEAGSNRMLIDANAKMAAAAELPSTPMPMVAAAFWGWRDRVVAPCVGGGDHNVHPLFDFIKTMLGKRQPAHYRGGSRQHQVG